MERLCREEGNPGVRGRPVPEATLLRVTEFKNVVKEEKAISQNKRYRSLYGGKLFLWKDSKSVEKISRTVVRILPAVSGGPRVLRTGEEAAPTGILASRPPLTAFY